MSLTVNDHILFLQILFFIQNIKYSDVFLGANYLVLCPSANCKFWLSAYVTVRSHYKTFATFLEKRYIVRPDFHIVSSIVLGFDMKINYL